jgi:hypothetical protein
MSAAARIGLRRPTPREPRTPGRQEWEAFAVAQGMSADDAATVADEALKRWYEEDEDG